MSRRKRKSAAIAAGRQVYRAFRNSLELQTIIASSQVGMQGRPPHCKPTDLS